MWKLLIDLVRKSVLANPRIDGKIYPAMRDKLRYSYSITGSVAGKMASVVRKIFFRPSDETELSKVKSLHALASVIV
jgi:hypothetical protein